MNPGGVVLVIAGVWVLCQVLGGDALNRLGLVTSEQAPPEDPGLGFGDVPDRGYNNVPHDAQGRPL